MTVIHVPDIDGPTEPLCWKQSRAMVRCDRRKGHSGKHTWELAEEIEAAQATWQVSIDLNLAQQQQIEGLQHEIASLQGLLNATITTAARS